ncbi:MAG: hypothetical protein QXQ29_06335, partial [Candidatus Bathyarchaeia archaeon]
MKTESLKKEILELLDRDIEFRYAIAGYLGLSEILRRLDSLAEEQVRLREEQTRIWEEIGKVWIEIKALREEQVKVWEEIKALRDEQARLREDMVAGFRRHDEILERHSEEIAKLRQDMIEGFERHDKEFARIWEEIKALREEHVKFRKSQIRLERSVDSLRRAMISGFGEMSRF